MFRERDKELDDLGPIETRWYPTEKNYSGISFHDGCGRLPEWIPIFGGGIVVIVIALIIAAVVK